VGGWEGGLQGEGGNGVVADLPSSGSGDAYVFGGGGGRGVSRGGGKREVHLKDA
jgi:hypothetical protein